MDDMCYWFYLLVFKRLRLLISLYKEVCLILSKLVKVSTKRKGTLLQPKTEII